MFFPANKSNIQFIYIIAPFGLSSIVHIIMFLECSSAQHSEAWVCRVHVPCAKTRRSLLILIRAAYKPMKNDLR